jgi:hypothetical protein
MPTSDFQTLLVLSSMGIPFYSARGLKQTLTPIQPAAANLMRDINGTLVDLRDTTDLSFLKYASHIECGDSDTRVPLCFDNVWPGKLVTVSCVCELAYTSGGTPGRTAVSGSTRTDAQGVTFYRPILNMMVMNFSSTESEWEATVAWTLDLEEI